MCALLSDLLSFIISLIQHNQLFKYCFILRAASKIFQRIYLVSDVTVLARFFIVKWNECSLLVNSLTCVHALVRANLHSLQT